MPRAAAVVALLSLFAAPLAAYDRGTLLFGTSRGLWVYQPAWEYALPEAWPLVFKLIPFYQAEFVAPSPHAVVFHEGRTVSLWDGQEHAFTEPGKGYRDLFTHEAPLGEIAPIGGGIFLVPERWTDDPRPARLIEFATDGRRIAEFAFPVLTAGTRSFGARYVELLSDRCTLLYTLGSDDPGVPRVRRMNICSGETGDFAALLPGQTPGAIRQLPNGNVVVADGAGVFEYAGDGALLRTYDFPGVTDLALTPDGSSFYAAGVTNGIPALRLLQGGVYGGAARSILLGNPGSSNAPDQVSITGLAVVGEWRAAASGPPRRAVRRR